MLDIAIVVAVIAAGVIGYIFGEIVGYQKGGDKVFELLEKQNARTRR